ncbi:hypothetical protein [Rathayibacter iranicus]|uniref:Uncharacterized protein n=2 Tax=Rathayibacter iranicus TaxID=59737 RepID=A0AAD1ADI6_9MICO|nr:hypothetical protein [Rathayibacter iranicus]AZZ55055.1 hypothetical protein C7V51_03485 [Rathayibacter iranicus]MWV32223.1 hypothetical protein [Rathayibacter iranicus NCPPB 2253 = VKM Ac-1602]PPI61963.1 hypothetical protein C5E08_03495 [Rathayibacter iranicus]PWJ61550.1 hypothetical protein B0H03_11622 [Rathayibacter iranicus NCPPB 2253 = VKM Ac-1602]
MRTVHGQKFVITFREAFFDAPHDLVASGAVRFGWLITCGANARVIVEQAFSGRLAGGYVRDPTEMRREGAAGGD